MNSSQIMKITNRDEAFNAISLLDIPSRKKATLRYSWKKRNDPTSIKKRPQKARKKKRTNTPAPSPPPSPPQLTQTEIIQQLREQIQKLQKQLDALLESSRMNNEEICPICDRDAEGYDLPCRHSICHPCFTDRLVDGKIQCTVCTKNFEFDDF
jgi:hypothetical protein